MALSPSPGVSFVGFHSSGKKNGSQLIPGKTSSARAQLSSSVNAAGATLLPTPETTAPMMFLSSSSNRRSLSARASPPDSTPSTANNPSAPLRQTFGFAPTSSSTPTRSSPNSKQGKQLPGSSSEPQLLRPSALPHLQRNADPSTAPPPPTSTSARNNIVELKPGSLLSRALNSSTPNSATSLPLSEASSQADEQQNSHSTPTHLGASSSLLSSALASTEVGSCVCS